MTSLGVLDRDQLGAIADLCRRSIPDPPTVEELDDALFAADQPALLRGDPQVGVVATVTGESGGYVRLLVVDSTCGAWPRSRAARRCRSRHSRRGPPIGHDRRGRPLLPLAWRPEQRDHAAVSP